MPDHTESPVLEALTKAYVDGWTDALHNGATGLYMHADVPRHVMNTALSDPAVVYELPLVKPLLLVLKAWDFHLQELRMDTPEDQALVTKLRDLLPASVRDYIEGQS
jgi:hypothetical protein